MTKQERIDALNSMDAAKIREAEMDYINSTIREVYAAEKKGKADPSIDSILKDFEKYATEK